MKKAEECQEVQRREIPDIFESKQSLEENLRMQTNKPALKFSSGLNVKDRGVNLREEGGGGKANEDQEFLILY